MFTGWWSAGSSCLGSDGGGWFCCRWGCGAEPVCCGSCEITPECVIRHNGADTEDISQKGHFLAGPASPKPPQGFWGGGRRWPTSGEQHHMWSPPTHPYCTQLGSCIRLADTKPKNALKPLWLGSGGEPDSSINIHCLAWCQGLT